MIPETVRENGWVTVTGDSRNYISIDGCTDDDELVPFKMVERKPVFQLGGVNNFAKWVNEHLIYPEDAQKAKKQGRVVVQFTITKTGKMENVKVLRGTFKSLDEEALRIVKSSPVWEPGKMQGKAVDVTYTFPIIFRLK